MTGLLARFLTGVEPMLKAVCTGAALTPALTMAVAGAGGRLSRDHRRRCRQRG